MAQLCSILSPAKSVRNKENGFALAEVLVATAIIAAVIAVTAASLSSALRLAQRAQASQALLMEARNIGARLHANLPEEEILKGYTDWDITYGPVDNSLPRQRDTAFPIEVVVESALDPQVTFTTIILLTETDYLERTG